MDLHRQIMDPPTGKEVIFLNHDRLDCRRSNLRVVSKEEARQHHRVRCDSKSSVKGVRFNAESDTWSAFTYRHGHCHHVGTFYAREEAAAAYESELKRENPDLHAAPPRVERTSQVGPDERGNPDAQYVAERS
jgi:HNH endonuclease